MNVAECLVLLCLLSQLAALTLPSVVPQSSSGQENLGEPPKEAPNYNDVEDEHTRLVMVYKWCADYKYCPPPAQNPEDMTAEDIKAEICEYVKGIKSFYRQDSSSCDLTKELLDIMSKPRCSGPDKQTSQSDGRKKRWTRLGSRTWQNMPVSYRFKSPLSSSSFSLADQESIARFCAGLWSGSSSLSMQFTTAASANIEIEFVYIDGQWGTVGQALSPSFSGSSYLKLDSSELWKRDSRDSSQGVSMQWAMCHEMGHNLGLGHSTDSNAIMYPSYVSQDDSRLNSDDVNGIQTLYPGSSRSNPAPQPPPSQPIPAPNPAPQPNPVPRPPAPQPMPPQPIPAPAPRQRQRRPWREQVMRAWWF